MDLNCVEGWNFTAKWTGPRLDSIFKDAKVRPEAKIAIFYTADVPSGYTSLDLDYIRDNDIIIALKLNDVTLHQERGFPFQVVAKKKYGYKWAKWVTRIELSSNTGFLGYWEIRGFSNSAPISLDLPHKNRSSFYVRILGIIYDQIFFIICQALIYEDLKDAASRGESGSRLRR